MTQGAPPELTFAEVLHLLRLTVSEIESMHEKHDLRRDADENHHHYKPLPEKPTRRTHAQQGKRGVKKRAKKSR